MITVNPRDKSRVSVSTSPSTVTAEDVLEKVTVTYIANDKVV